MGKKNFGELDPLWGLILAGGDGTRLSALTTAVSGESIPKQYCRLLDDSTLLESTIERVRQRIPLSRTLVIVNRDHVSLARSQCRGVPTDNIVIQPSNRDTGPGLVFALFALERRAGDAMVAIFPSDHYVDDEAKFMAYVGAAYRVLQRLPEKVVLLGIPPQEPDPRYGYVVPGHRVLRNQPTFQVERFEEKPTPDVARELHARGALWNSFVMVGRCRRLLRLIQSAAPLEYTRMADLRYGTLGMDAIYALTLRSWNFSQDVLSRVAPHLAVMRVEGVYWNDLGTPEAVLETLAIKRAAEEFAASAARAS